MLKTLKACTNNYKRGDSTSNNRIRLRLSKPSIPLDEKRKKINDDLDKITDDTLMNETADILAKLKRVNSDSGDESYVIQKDSETDKKDSDYLSNRIDELRKKVELTRSTLINTVTNKRVDIVETANVIINPSPDPDIKISRKSIERKPKIERHLEKKPSRKPVTKPIK